MTGNPNIDIDIVEHDGTVVIAVVGEVDLWAAAEFASSLASAEESDAPAIVLDLDRVSFMDSAGLHVLLQFSTADRNRDRVSLTRGSPRSGACSTSPASGATCRSCLRARPFRPFASSQTDRAHRESSASFNVALGRIAEVTLSMSGR